MLEARAGIIEHMQTNRKRALHARTSVLWRVVTIAALVAVVAIPRQGHGEAWPPEDAEVAAFFDAMMSEQLERRHTLGAIISVVAGDRVVFAKGYGSARLGEESAVDAERTLFRVASVSKLLTTTAALQLVEQGKLDLDEDVNTYLKEFRIPETFEQAITLRHLLTHTAGFDDRFLGMSAPTPETLGPLGTYLAERLPPRVMPPGDVASYSNHGLALVGHLIEVVSGEPFVAYVDRHVFAPLGMTNSHFDLTPAAETPLATGYTYLFGRHHEAIYDYPQTVPASSLATTATDMARFMIMQLCQGEYGGVPILKPETVAEMHRRQFAHHPKLRGRALAFSERFVNGRRVLEHTGLIWGSTSLLMLVPEEGAGLFVSCNADTRGLYGFVRGRFLEHYFPGPQPSLVDAQALEGTDERIARVCGAYRSNRYCRGTFLKFGVMIPEFVSEAHVRPGKRPGVLRLDWGGRRDHPQAYVETEPYYFCRVRNDTQGGTTAQIFADDPGIAFRARDGETATHLFLGTGAYERLAWYESWPMLLAATGASAGLLLSGLFAWPIGAWLRRRKGEFLETGGTLAHRLCLGVCILDIGFVLGFAAFVATLNPNTIGHGVPPMLVVLLLIPLLSLPATFAFVASAVWMWWKGHFGFVRRIHMTAIALSGLVFLGLLYYWKLLGFHFG